MTTYKKQINYAFYAAAAAAAFLWCQMMKGFVVALWFEVSDDCSKHNNT